MPGECPALKNAHSERFSSKGNCRTIDHSAVFDDFHTLGKPCHGFAREPRRGAADCGWELIAQLIDRLPADVRAFSSASSATVTVHRVGVLDLSSLTAQTIPMTGNPFNINRAFWPRYWA
jgi:hypothetical protein